MLTNGKKVSILVIYVVGMVLLPMVFFIVGALLFGMRDMELMAIVNFLAYLILCGVLLFLSRHVFKEDFKKIESWGKFILQMGFGLLLTFSSIFVGNSIVLLLGTTEAAANQEHIVNALNAMPILMMITAVVFAPIVEEIVFRLVLINLFNWKPIYGLIFSSLIFGLVHVIIGGWIHIITYSLAGLVFGYFYLRNNKNIWHVTILHVLHNGLTIGLVFWLQSLIEMYYG